MRRLRSPGGPATGPARALAALALLSLLSSGCATVGHRSEGALPAFALRSALVTERARFEIWYDAPDEPVVELLRSTLRTAASRVTRWAPLQRLVVVRVYPSHDALETAVNRHGYGWLRAWARYDEIFLQSPQTFSVFERGKANLAELLTHELTHCLMYQLAAPERRWRAVDREIPIWLREGMASWTANQGPRRASEARLAGWVREHRRDPITDAPALYRDEAPWVYAAAHWAFAFLVERYGPGSVRRLLAALREGAPFDRAFETAVGIGEAAFTNEVLRYLLWGGYEARAHPPPAELLAPAAQGGGSTGARSLSLRWR